MYPFCLRVRCQTKAILVSLLSDISQFPLSGVEEDHRLEVIVVMLTVGSLQTAWQGTEEDPGGEGGRCQFVMISRAQAHLSNIKQRPTNTMAGPATCRAPD